MSDDTDCIAKALRDAKVTRMKMSDVHTCPFLIIMPEHYRPDGSCKCSNAEHRKHMIAEWEYSESDFVNIPLVD